MNTNSRWLKILARLLRTACFFLSARNKVGLTTLHLLIALSLILPQLVATGQVVKAAGLFNPLAEANDPTPTPTPTEIIGSDDLTPTPSQTPTSIPETPINTPTVMPSATLTGTATATATALPSSPTPTETPLPTLPSPTLTPGTPLSFTLVTTPTALIPGFPFMLNLVGQDLGGISAEDELLMTVRVPEGVTPVTLEGVSFDAGSQTLTLAKPFEISHLVWQLAPEVHGPYLFEVVLYRGNEAHPVSVTVPEYGVFEIPQTGGKAEGLNGRVSVSVPEGAVSEGITLRIQPVPTGKLPYSLSGHPFRLTASGQTSGREITQFSQPLEIKIPYNEDTIHGDEFGLALFYYDEKIHSWGLLSSRVDKEANVLTSWTTHFSDFDVDVNSWEAATLPTLDSFQVSQFTGAATYSMPFWVPPGPGDLQPSLSLSYNSQTVDNASAKTQAGWAGMGWSIDTGYIQRDMNGTDDFFGDDTFSITT
ncbi:MAG: hypothetical protein HUU38_32110, partial [Anaerolineales bacterium]|nr:hypothetical protein [Anaerolineales bacterium]